MALLAYPWDRGMTSPAFCWFHHALSKLNCCRYPIVLCYSCLHFDHDGCSPLQRRRMARSRQEASWMHGAVLLSFENRGGGIDGRGHRSRKIAVHRGLSTSTMWAVDCIDGHVEEYLNLMLKVLTVLSRISLPSRVARLAIGYCAHAV